MNKRRTQAALLAVALCVGAARTANAQDEAPAPAAAVDAGAVGELDAGVAKDAPPPEVGSNADLKRKLEAVHEEYREMRERLKNATAAEKRVAIAGLLAALCWLLFAAIKRFGRLSKKGKRWLPWVSLGLGVFTGVFDVYANGAGWLSALIVGGGPPLSVLAQELLKLIGKGTDE